MNRSGRVRSLVFLLAALITMIVLSIGINNMALQPGTPFYLMPNDRPPLTPEGEESSGQTIILTFRVLLAFVLVLLPIYIIYSLWTPAGRRRLLTQVLLLAFIFWLQNILINLARRENGGREPAANEAGLEPMPVSFAQAEEFIASASPWIMIVVTVVLVGLTTLLVVGLLRFFLSERGIERRESLDRLAQKAQQAVDALQSGKDLKDTVIRCYYQMNELLAQERGIQRGLAATPREFEERLVKLGLPAEPVRTLTRVFEEVRYGSVQAGQKQEYMAVQSLVAIVQYCRGEQ